MGIGIPNCNHLTCLSLLEGTNSCLFTGEVRTDPGVCPWQFPAPYLGSGSWPGRLLPAQHVYDSNC